MPVVPRVTALALRLLTLAVALAIPSRGVAADWTVDITADENDGSCSPGDCSLREALGAAGDGDTVLFSLSGSPPWTITLSSALGPLVIAENVTLVGPGAADLAVSGNAQRRVVTVAAGAEVAISGLTLRDGRAHQSGDKHGGCVQVLGALTLESSRIEDCQAWSAPLDAATAGGDGGGIYVAATGELVGELLVFDGDRAGLGAATSNFPASNGSKGGRGGGLASAGAAVVRRSTFVGGHGGDGGGPNGPGGEGGGIAILAGGSLLLEESTLSGNTSGDGATFMTVSGADGKAGGLFCEAECTLNNVTVSGNAIGAASAGSSAQGGGLAVIAGTTRLRNVTVAGNSANGTGGGIARVTSGAIVTRHSLLAGNSGASSQHDCASAAGGVIANGYNLIRVNNGCAGDFGGSDLEGTAASPLEPLLGALGDEGGPTATRPLAAGSPAIDAGDPTNGCLAWDPVSASDVAMPTDQRGEPRPTDGDGDAVEDCDIGAYERAGVPPEEHLLTIALDGGGTGVVTSEPVGIACPPDCTQSYVFNLTVDLTPAADAGAYFAGWSGDCSGSGACSVPMSADRSVTASFELLRTLTVVVEGEAYGSVGSAPPGIACPGDCSEPYEQTVQVDLAAQPAAGAFFVGWSGDCSGSGACSLAMTIDRGVTATFLPFLVFADDFESGDYCAWSAIVGGDPCPPRA